MINNNQHDKRKHRRIKFHKDVVIHSVMPASSGNILEVQQGDGIKVKGSDISEGGIRLEIEDTKFATPFLQIRLNIQKFKSVITYVKTVWNRGNTYGLQFLYLDNDSREQIREYVDNQNK
jgi:hypothetical protein